MDDLVPLASAFRWNIGGETGEDEEVESIVEGIIFRGGRHLLLGLPKTGKSFASLAMCGAIRNDRPFLNYGTEPARVTYLTEEPNTTFTAKLERFGLLHDEGFQYLRRNQAGVSAAKWPDIVEAVRDQATAMRADLVVVDVLHRWARFAEGQENDAGVVAEAIGALDPLTEEGIAVLVLHHGPWKAKRARGSTDLHGIVDSLLYIEGSGSGARSLEFMGGRFDTEFDHVTFRLGADGLLESFGRERIPAVSQILEAIGALKALGGIATANQVADELGWSLRVAEKWLVRAERLSRIKRKPDGPRGPFEGENAVRIGRPF
jgi:hypothetical protein